MRSTADSFVPVGLLIVQEARWGLINFFVIVHIRGGAFMLTLLARLTLLKTKDNFFCQTFVVQWYSTHWNTGRSRRAYAPTSWLSTPEWLKLANDAFYLISSAVFQCMEYHWTTKSRQKTLFFVFKVLAGRTRLTWTLHPSYIKKRKYCNSNEEFCDP
jgi:hypothetical protein